MKLIIKVVQDPDKKGQLFKYGQKNYTLIQGIKPLELPGSSLLIVRNALPLDYTNNINSCGAHDEGTAFRDLKNLSKETALPNGDGAAFLIPDNFRVGDLLVISCPRHLSDDDLFGVTGLLQKKV